MITTTRRSAFAAALILSTCAMPLAAFAQAAPDAPAATAPAAPATPPPAGAPATPDATAPAAGAPAATPAPGAPAPETPPPGTPPTAGAPAPDATAPAPGTPAPATPAATPAPAPTGPDAAAAPPTANGTMAVANPYGLSALWKNGDFVSRGVLIMLAIMSLGSWYIMITKAWEQTRVFSASKPAKNVLRTSSTATEGVNSLKPNSPFRYIGETGITASEHHEGALIEQIDLNTWITMSIQRAVDAIQGRLSGGLAFLASVGSVSPFVGLFGTVWGIYHALTAIGIAGQASIDKVAGPVGEALIMTAIGLLTAVPAVLGYNYLVRRNKNAMERVRNFSSDLHSVLLSAPRTVVSRLASRGSPDMAMSLGSDSGGEEDVTSAINTTPLVDVMLVLLIIFLITIPVVTHTIPVKLPEDSNVPTVTKPENINIAVNSEGDVFWNEALVPDNATLVKKMDVAARKVPQPEVHIRGDQDARYEYIGRVVFDAQRAGIIKLGFITQPPPRG